MLEASVLEQLETSPLDPPILHPDHELEDVGPIPPASPTLHHHPAHAHPAERTLELHRPDLDLALHGATTPARTARSSAS